MKSLSLSILSAGFLLSAGCTVAFDPYNELIGFRVLAIRTNPPTLDPRGRATIDALVHTTPGADVEYDWSWCPFRGSATEKFECAVSHDDLQKMIDATVGPGVVTVPPYALSSTATATFSYELPPQLFLGLCEALKMQSLPDFVEAPDCDGTYEITLRLVARSEGKEVIALKKLGLVYSSEAQPNSNPAFGAVSYWPSDQPESSAVPLERGSPPTLRRDTKYMLKLDIDESSSETVTSSTGMTSRELLFATWFTEGGATDSQRTTFIDGEVPFENLRKNELTTPRKPDYSPDLMKLFFVLRDNRGGVTWDVREVGLVEPAQ